MLLLLLLAAGLSVWSNLRSGKGRPAVYRDFKPRLSRTTVYHPVRRDRSNGASRSAAGRVAASVAAGTSGPHDLAVARLLAGDTAGSISLLTPLAEAPQSQVLSDLSAALLVRSTEVDDIGLAVDALDYADRALALDVRNAPASFNRALALERLGMVGEARKAWNDYLALDRVSAWSDEALEHLGALGVMGRDAEARTLTAATARRSPSESLSAVRSLAAQHPQATRLWAESVLMTDWAAAFASGDYATASRRLLLARQIAAELKARSNEAFLGDAIEAVEQAISDGKAARLAHAYMTYREGRLAYSNDRPSEAEQKLRSSELLFAESGSPMAYVARYYLGSVLHAQLRLVEAADVLDALAAERLDARGYRALDATVGWERGACLMERGSISQSLDVFERSREIFRSLSEDEHVASMNALIANALAFAGDESGSWRVRRESLLGFSRSGNRGRLLIVIESAASAAVRDRRWNRARALLNMSTAEAVRQQRAVVAAEAFTFRAFAQSELHDSARASSDIQSARSWIGLIGDPRACARAEANLVFVEALRIRGDDPHAALRSLSAAISFFQTAERRVELPRLYLERAAVYERLGQPKDARHDLETGISVVEVERRLISDLNQRAMLLATSRMLFDRAIDLAMKAGDHEGAFNLVERHRARALIDMFELGQERSAVEVSPLSVQAIRESLASDAAIVQTSLLPDRLVVFVVRRRGLIAATTDVSAERAQALLNTFRENCRKNRNDLKAAAAAESLLLGPVRHALADVHRIAIVPDPHLSSLPFAALYDATRNRFLIEDAAILVAPSATLAIKASAAARPVVNPVLLAVGAGSFDDERYPSAAPLPRAAAEARVVAARYDRSVILVDDAASVSNVTAALPRCEVAHFAAHGIVKQPAANSSLLLAPEGDDHGELRVHDISRLRLKNVRVVVLAACDSAAPLQRGDGAENLGLAFIAAGVPAVVGSLTELSDEASAPLMSALHERIARGDDPLDALRDMIRMNIRDAAGTLRPSLQWSTLSILGGSRRLLDRGTKGAS